MKYASSRQAFTLIELIIVIAIIAILGSLAYLSLSGETSYARDARRQADLKTLENAVSMSNAQNRRIFFPTTTITTGTTDTDVLSTSAGKIRVLRNAQAFFLDQGFVNSSILAKVPRDPSGSPYIGAFINTNQFQIVGALENAETKKPEALIVGSFKEGAIVDNILTAIDNDDKMIPVGNASQFIAGDVIEINTERMLVEDVSKDSGSAGDEEVIIVTRGYDSTTAQVHSLRDPIKLYTAASNASSLFCLGSLVQNAAGDPTSLAVSEIPSDITVTLASISLENTYTCSSSGNIQNGGVLLPYEVNN